MSADRPFASFTPADHARISYAQTAWGLITSGYAAVVPERDSGSMTPEMSTPAIWRSAIANQAATRLSILGVIVSYESGHTWEQIGRRFSVTRQSAHERFAPEVKAFHDDLNTILNMISNGTSVRDAIETLPFRDLTGLRGYVVDTGWHAPRIDAWLGATVEIPGSMIRSFNPGELLARLSDEATSTGSHYHGGLRGPDAPRPRCPFTADVEGADEPGLFFVCTDSPGHSGRHSLAVSGAE